jgi:hypothetical protein
MLSLLFLFVLLLLLVLLLKTNSVFIVVGGVIVDVAVVSTGSINTVIVSICSNIHHNLSTSYSESQ